MEKMEALGRAASYTVYPSAATPPFIGRAIWWLAIDPDADELTCSGVRPGPRPKSVRCSG